MKRLMQRQVHKKLQLLMNFKEVASGVPSWIRYMRKALHMTPQQLAQRMGLASSSLYQLERQEISGKINLQNLKKAAEVMECRLIHAFVPYRPLDEIIDEQARKKAKKLVMSSNLQMEFENQAVSQQELKHQVEELIEVLKNSKHLWEDDPQEDPSDSI